MVGYRLARPERAAAWLGILAYAGALAAVYVADRTALPASLPPLAARAAGALLLLAGLLVAGAPARAARRAIPPGARVAPSPLGRRDRWWVHAGLALVLVGQLLRAPTPLGAAAVLTAALVLAATAWLAARG